MLRQRPVRPCLSTFKTVVVGIETYEVDGKLAPSDELVQEGYFVGLGRIRFLDGQRDCHRTDVAEVQVGGEPAGVVNFRLVAPGFVAVQLVLDETAKLVKRR